MKIIKRRKDLVIAIISLSYGLILYADELTIEGDLKVIDSIEAASDNPINTMHIFDDGRVVFAQPNQNFDPITGDGARMMWIPYWSAFRAGGVTNANWSGANVGALSTAFGFNTVASGIGSFATGSYSKATGQYSTAFGSSTTASGDSSTAMGQSTTAAGNISTSMGYFTFAMADSSLAIGNINFAYGFNATTLGGYINNSSGPAATVVGGAQNSASGEESVVVGGRFNSSSEHYATVLGGHNNTASAINATITGGHDNIASTENASAFGTYNTASGYNSTVFGSSNKAESYYSFALGRLNTGGFTGANGDTVWNNEDPLFELGNGINSSTRHNAITVYKNGKTVIHSPDHLIPAEQPDNLLEVNGNARFTANVTLDQPQGDILMGSFTN